MHRSISVPLLATKYGWLIDRAGKRIGGLAWRVLVQVGNDPMYQGRKTVVVEVAFATERDAKRGVDALVAAGLNTLEKLKESRPRLKQIMCESLAW